MRRINALHRIAILHEHVAEGCKLNAIIEANLGELGYGE
jgi:hypothetical protein